MTELTTKHEQADAPVVGVMARLVAYLFDAFLVALATYVAVAVLHAIVGPTARIVDVGGVSRLAVDPVRIVVDSALATTVSGAYFVGSWLNFGWTPAQRVIGARVERVDGRGRLSRTAAVARWLALGAPFGLMSALLLGAPALGAILAVVIATWHAILLVTTARDRRKRGLHDRVAGSVVRRRRPGA